MMKKHDDEISFIIFQTWDGTGGWNSSLWNTSFCLPYEINATADVDLVPLLLKWLNFNPNMDK